MYSSTELAKRKAAIAALERFSEVIGLPQSRGETDSGEHVSFWRVLPDGTRVHVSYERTEAEMSDDVREFISHAEGILR